MTDLAALVVRLQADNSEYVKALEQASKKLEKFGKEQEGALSEVKEQFAEFGKGIAAAFTLDKLIEFSSEAIESAASLEKMSQSTGIGVEALGALRLATAASGLTTEELGLSLKKLNVNISEAAGNVHSKAAVAFGALGISVTDANGKLKDAGALLPELADKFAAMEDGPNKVAFAVELLGKQGQNMIPVLNKGAAGLKEFEDAAKAAGFTTAATAEQAEEFEQKVNVLKATLVDGFAAQLVGKLLPAMSSLVDAFNDTGRGAGAMSVLATAIAGAFKVVAVIVLNVAGELTNIGKSIGAVAAAAVEAAQGNFKEAAAIWKDSNAENLADAQATADAIADIWEAGTARELSIISTAEAEKKRIRGDGKDPNLAEAEKIDAAKVKLEDYSNALKAQAAAFGLGKAALIEYDLQFGALHKDVVEAGAAGAIFVAAIRANAAALQQKMDTKQIKDVTDALQEGVIKYGQSELAAEKYKNQTGELGQALDRMADHGVAARAKMDALAAKDIWQKDQDALEAIDRETLTMTGHLKEAAAAAFDFQNKLLIKNTQDTNDAAGQAKLAHLKDQAVAQGAFNEEVEKARVVEERLKDVEDEINLERAKGSITELGAQAKLEDARSTAITELGLIHDAEVKIADSAIGNPKEIAEAKALADAIKGVQKQTDALEESVRDKLEAAFADNFEKLITGAESFRKAVMNMLKDVEKMFLDAIAKNYAQQLFGVGGAAGGAAGGLSSLMGLVGGSGGGGSGIASTALGATGSSEESLLAGIPGLAAGGTIPLGSFGLVGEQGPELAYSGSQNLNIAPLSSAANRPVNVTNHFMIEAPGGTISRQSQMQTAAAAARSLGQANRRNNQ